MDMAREATGDMTLAVEYRVDQAPESAAYLVVGCGDDCEAVVDVSSELRSAEQGAWVRMDVKLSCFASAGADMSGVTSPFGLRSEGAMGVSISGVRLTTNEGQAPDCPGT